MVTHWIASGCALAMTRNFIGDIQGLLRAEEQFDKTKALEAYEQVKEMFIERLKK